ncbi:TIGR00282 family metallophosphoesterase [Hydrogeniiclostridium mannosilyticum]|uniref:TIGR00282 family metallophosphoesterase n=1 Tax=Hydrogeniiclostridium mannosilyticum TaxID=2764322 RepID=UPI0018A959D4|nr:TIGR00282 family metallophosphoesterase [Hydrogeniiclostridium mannosilyticum]
MNLMMIGDVVGSTGCKFLRAHLPAFKKLKQIDVVVANGENSADGNGITPTSADYLFKSGVDVITAGNHTFRRKECYELFDTCETLLRPANFPPSAPGRGLCILDLGRLQVAVINLMGVVYMEPMDSPFDTADRLLSQDLPRVILVDIHAEATGEKRSLAYYLDGRVSAVIGTHTHVQTADECILENGTAYLSDAGMTGPLHSVLGVKPELVIQKMRSHMPVRFDLASGDCGLDGVLLDIDERTGKARSIERVQIR